MKKSKADKPRKGKKIITGEDNIFNIPGDTGEVKKAPRGKTNLDLGIPVFLIIQDLPFGNRFDLNSKITTIGRAGGRKNDLEIMDTTISRSQATIRYDDRTRSFTLTNESSTNPTFVNSQEARPSMELKDGDLIQMGKTKMRFHYPHRE